MSTAALFTWIGTVLAGMVLLVIWLMEYDTDHDAEAASRLPVLVVSAHALLGVGGLLVWGFYLFTDEDQLAWASVAGLSVIVLLGLVMVGRWIGVYRAYAAPSSSPSRLITVPPERHFPRPVVVVHGAFAIATVILVVSSVFFTSS
jgi:hypothetical protein